MVKKTDVKTAATTNNNKSLKKTDVTKVAAKPVSGTSLKLSIGEGKKYIHSIVFPATRRMVAVYRI